MCECVCVCVCVCVSNTTKLQKNYMFKMSFFLWLETGSFSETGKSLIVNVYFEAHPCCCFSLLLIHTGGSVLPLRRNLVKERKGV